MTNFNCRICRSKLKGKIEEEVSLGKEFREVAKKYIDSFDCDLHALEQSLATHQKKHTHKAFGGLKIEEQQLLDRFRAGEVSLDEASRIVASKVFEKILKNPDDVKFIDFFRTELLKIKQQETSDRNYWAMELVNRMFSGNLPARNCVQCGHPFFEESKTLANGATSLDTMTNNSF